MYLSFFGLAEKPFAITPDARYLYLSERHAEALAHLLYGITESGGFVQLTGEVGTGKTTIVRSLLAQTPKDTEIALILNPRMTAPEFLLTICEELGIGVPDDATESVKDLVDILNDYLLRSHARGRRIVLVVDEAQNLMPDVLEQVRLLTNLETSTQKLLQIILIGQPELRDLLARNDLRQLAQRITGRFHLDPLSRAETTAYVRHRLRVAGATADIFSGLALREVHRLSGGVPRLINVICDRALLGAYTQDRHHVTGAIVDRAASEVLGRRIAPAWLPWAAGAAAAVVLALGAFAISRFLPTRDAVGPPAATAPGDVPEASSRPAAATGEAAPAAPAPASLSQPAGMTPASTIPTGQAHDLSSASVPQRRLAALLAAHARETDVDHAFERLFAQWSARYVADRTDPCTQASRQGLECLVERGSFGQLRLYNRPAILILSDDAGRSHQVVMTALGDERVTLDLGGGQEVRIDELSRYWLGDFVLLWKPATGSVKDLSVGMRDDGVRWLRQSLRKLRGMPADQPGSNLFDVELSRLVMEFQREHRLAIDGVAGIQTQVILSSAVASPGAPLLLQSGAVHGS